MSSDPPSAAPLAVSVAVQSSVGSSCGRSRWRRRVRCQIGGTKPRLQSLACGLEAGRKERAAVHACLLSLGWHFSDLFEK